MNSSRSQSQRQRLQSLRPSRFIKLVTLALLMAFISNAPAKAADMTGAGSTFVYPLLAKWADAYKKETGHTVNYQSIGSGAGIKQIESKTVDFGATDKPLSSEELQKQGLVQFPIISGGVVPVVHIGELGADQLKLTGPILADIFLGKIKKWNDPAIAALNKDLKLPDQWISVVHRSDGSGTSFIWTNYLCKISSEWKSKIGEGTSVHWLTGVGGKGNEGVASFVSQIDGSIGYIEYAFALQNKMSTAQLQNQAGEFISPTLGSFEAAVASADWAKAKDFNLVLTDATGKKTWPVAGSTFVLMQKISDHPEQTRQALAFFRWAYGSKGQALAEELSFVPMPAKVTAMIEKTWKAEIKSKDGKALSIP